MLASLVHRYPRRLLEPRHRRQERQTLVRRRRRILPVSHVRQCDAGEIQYSLQIDIQHNQTRLLLHTLQSVGWIEPGPLLNEPRVRNRVVDPSIFLQCRLEECKIVAVAARVTLLEMDCFGGGRFDDFFGSGCVDVAKDDFGAFGVEELDGRFADATGTACLRCLSV